MARRFFLSAALTIILATSLALPPRARGEQTPPEIANARNSAVGEINSDGVYVRSGAGDNYYPTTKLTKGASVTIVGEKFDWLKIVPPANSFCYVAKAFIDKNPDGTATANRDDVNVRAGSELNTVKTTVQSKLASGQAVHILGEVDEYYKITPPADAFVYVKKDYVDFKKVIAPVAQPAAPLAQQTPESTVTPQQTPTPGADPIITTAAATAQPSGAAAGSAIAAVPTTNPAVAAVETSFDKLEAEFDAASKLEIEQQPIADLTAGYEKVAIDKQLPESMRRMAEYRLQTLKVRAETKDQFLAVQKQQNEAKQKQLALKAEQEEIAQQIKQKDVKVYTAVGTLRTSSLQQGGQIMYRLTDPQTGRTVCYLRTDDAKVGAMLGQFIGVKGVLGAEPGLNLKVVQTSEFASVDPNELYRGVAAQIVPPSLLPQGAQAASGTDQ